MSNLYLDAYDAAVLRHWGELLKRHGASLRRPPAHGWRIRVVDVDDHDDRPVAGDRPISAEI